mgnify:CR=1 FL=1
MSGSQDRLQGNKIINFGCRLNAYEAEVMRDQAHDAGLQDAVIINTCAVTSARRGGNSPMPPSW